MPTLLVLYTALKQPQVNADSGTTLSTSTSTSTPSIGAKIGIAIGCSAILFVVLSSLLLRLAKWQDRRRGVLGVTSNQDDPRDTTFDDQNPPLSSCRRLRKKSIPGENAAGLDEEPNKHVSLPVLPPVFSRRESFNLSPFTDDEAQRKVRKKGREVYQMQRRSSWVDKYALYGPRVSMPKKKRRKGSGGMAWFRTLLGQKLSFKRPAGEAWIVGSPTLPYTNHDIAARQLAGKAPVPVPQRPQQVKARVTDTELAEILRMTATRLQDGNRSSRRRTTPAGYARGAASCESAQGGSGSVGSSRTSSPARSHRSAVTMLMCAELEANEAASPAKSRHSGQTPAMTPRHNRQVSQQSLFSEPDSVVAERRISQPEYQTALSSPHRSAKVVEPTSIIQEQPQQLRPFSTSSTQSSPLSTLYSEDEEQDGSSRESGHTPNQEIMEMLEAISACDTSVSRGDGSRSPFEDSGSARPLSVRKGTPGQVTAPRSLPEPRAADQTEAAKAQPPRGATLQFFVYTLDEDPFMVKTPPYQNLLRVSQIFGAALSSTVNMSPLSQDLHPRNETLKIQKQPIVRATNPVETPTTSPKTQRVDRHPSPTLSEGGLAHPNGVH